MLHVKQHYQSWNRDGSSPLLVPQSHEVSPTDQVLQKQVVEPLSLFSAVPFPYCFSGLWLFLLQILNEASKNTLKVVQSHLLEREQEKFI